jgi:formylglycine-generating enzyme
MKRSTPRKNLAFFVTVAMLSLGACTAVATPANPQVETLPDGNVRDPAPSAALLKDFFAVTRKNMVPLPAGTFQMGDWGTEVNPDGLPFDGSKDSKPLHKVQLSGFFIGKYPVTNAEFDMFTAAIRLPRINQDRASAKFRKPDRPAGVTWEGAKDFCSWLGKETGLPYDLPTEAQWEYAARSGGQRHVYPTDNGQLELGRNVPTIAQSDAAGGLVAVSAFPPNAAGIYAMGARINEFTKDWYSPDYYSKSPLDNPAGPSEGETHVVRGYTGSTDSAMTFKRWKKKEDAKVGSWTQYGGKTGGTDREIPYTKYSNFYANGFRCVLNIAKE